MPYKNPEHRRVRDRAWYKTNQKSEQLRLTKDRARRVATSRGRLVDLLKGARQRARETAMPFDVTIDDLHIPSHCPILEISISLAPDAPLANRPSLDRVRNDKGYIKGNVEIISHRANSWKGNKTLADVQRLATYMEANALSA